MLTVCYTTISIFFFLLLKLTFSYRYDTASNKKGTPFLLVQLAYHHPLFLPCLKCKMERLICPPPHHPSLNFQTNASAKTEGCCGLLPSIHTTTPCLTPPPPPLSCSKCKMEGLLCPPPPL